MKQRCEPSSPKGTGGISGLRKFRLCGAELAPWPHHGPLLVVRSLTGHQGRSEGPGTLTLPTGGQLWGGPSARKETGTRILVF